MPLTLSEKQKCEVCGSIAEMVSKQVIFDEILISLKCGHISYKDIPSDISSFKTDDGKSPMPFQVEGVRFAELAKGRAIITDEQGLGKTVQADLFLHFHPEAFPAVLVTKSAIKIQHVYEIYRWAGTRKVQVLFEGKEIAVPGFDVYITSYDMLKNEKMWSYITPKTLILDEFQKIKNHTSGRAVAATWFAESKNIEFVLGLSGTPIMNHAGELFPICHIVRPDLFPDYRKFLDDHCDYYETRYGPQVGGLRDPKAFKEYTKDFIIRRTLEEVMPDLKKLQEPRRFHHVELDRKVNKAYAKAMQELEELYYSEVADKQGQILAIMNRMRQITGVSKAIECADWVEDFVESCDRRISVFAHHHAAVDLLESKCNEYLLKKGLKPAVLVRSGDDSSQKLKELEHPDARLLIASGQAAGEGMDGLQLLCNDGIMLERQWNPGIEEQIESRLVRYGQTKPVSFLYFLASETIDDFFTELVEIKRERKDRGMDLKDVKWNEAGLVMELAHILVTRGKKKWSI